MASMQSVLAGARSDATARAVSALENRESRALHAQPWNEKEFGLNFDLNIEL